MDGPVAQTSPVGMDLLVYRSAVLPGVSLRVWLVAEVLQLYIEVIGPEHLAEAEKCVASIVVAAGVDEVAHLAVTAGGQADRVPRHERRATRG